MGLLQFHGVCCKNSLRLKQQIRVTPIHYQRMSRNANAFFILTASSLPSQPPAPGTPGGSAQTILTFYDDMSRQIGQRLPDGTATTNLLFENGLLKKTWGSRVYPVEYTYDYAGRMKTMKTWQDFAGNSGTATTTWNYDVNRGWLTNKVYDGESDTTADYTYTSAGRLARSYYTYDDASRLYTISDGTNSASYSYLANSPLVGQIEFKSNTTVSVTTTKRYDYLNRRQVAHHHNGRNETNERHDTIDPFRAVGTRWPTV
jgi:hypothetical protein